MEHQILYIYAGVQGDGRLTDDYVLKTSLVGTSSGYIFFPEEVSEVAISSMLPIMLPLLLN